MISERRKELLELLEKCPVQGDNPDSCPLHAIRNSGVEARAKWVANLSDSELDGVYEHHCRCYMQQISDRIENKIEGIRMRRMSGMRN